MKKIQALIRALWISSKQKTAFTLVEMLVVMFITIFFSATALYYSKGMRAQIDMFRGRAVLLHALYEVRTMATEAYRTAQDSSPAPCGFGIRLENNSSVVELFSYTPDDVANKTKVCDEFNPDALQNFKGEWYSKGKSIKKISLSGVVVKKNEKWGGDAFDLLFVPPNPLVIFPFASTNDVRVEVNTIGATPQIGYVSINKYGQISISEDVFSENAN